MRTFFSKTTLFLVALSMFCTMALSVHAAEDFEDLTLFDPDSTAAIDHSAWDAILNAYVTPSSDGVNRFDYGRVTFEDKQSLEGYVHALEAIDLSRYNRNEQFAFWANLYNAVTVNLVIDAYPVASIRKIKSGAFSSGPWSKKRIQIGARELSLDDIEHKVLRKYWRDPRVHYALNCASIGCPNLPRKAFTGQMLNVALDAAARTYINHSRGAHIDKGKLTVSSIYHWYREDFGNSDQGVIDHLMQFAQSPFAQELASIQKISNHDYDWSLNDVTTN